MINSESDLIDFSDADIACDLPLDYKEPQHKGIKVNDENHDDDVKIKSIGVARYYINQVSRFALLDAKEEQRLSRLSLQGDTLARDAFIRANLRLVIKIAYRYLYRGLELADLIEEGNLGLMRAIEKFDPDKGFKFSTYGTWWIRQYIEKAIIDQGGLIRMPAHIARAINKRKRSERSFLQKEHRQASVDELSKATDQDAQEIHRQRIYNGRMVSINSPLGDDDENSLLDILEDEHCFKPDEIVHNELAKHCIDILMDQLEDNERYIVRYRFGLNDCTPRSLESIAVDFGISRERARKIEKAALSKLKKSLERNGRGLEALIEY